MRDDVIMSRHLSLAGRIHKKIPDSVNALLSADTLGWHYRLLKCWFSLGGLVNQILWKHSCGLTYFQEDIS